MNSLPDVRPHATRPTRKPSRQAGFTLLELMVVIVILGMLAAIATPQVMKYLGGAKVDTARLQIQNLSTILDMYRLQTGNYPSTAEGLAVLVEKPVSAANWQGPYVKRRESLVDPWGSPFQYRYPGQHAEFDIYSLGESRSEGGKVIANW